MRDIDTTVNFMRDLLKHDASTRSNTSSPGYGSTPVPAAQSKDATMYKHDDSRSGTYKPSGRHLDRKSVRYAGEDSSADIGDIRRQLQNTSALLDRSNEDSMRKSAEDEELEQEVDDLKYKVKRIQQDIEYVSKGRRSAEKDEEKRKYERELLYLMHEKLPELERRQRQREDEKRMEDRAGVRARDKRNETHGRYSRDDRDERDDRDWLRGTYDRDRDRDRASYRRDSRDRDRDYDRDRNDDRYRDRSRDRNEDRDYRPRSPPQNRSPPPAPPPVPAAAASAPPAPPAPTSQAAAAPSTKNMSAEERTKFIREQAQRRIQDRLKALGVESAPTDQPTVDRSVEDRLQQEKQEAAEKAQKAEKEQQAREEARQARLAGTGGSKDEGKPKSPQPPVEAQKSAPKPPPSMGGKKVPPAPPNPRTGNNPSKARPPPVSAPAEDPAEVEIRRREEAMQKAKEDRKKRLQELDQEEAEERKREEDILAARKSRSVASQQSTPPVGTSPPPPPPIQAAPTDKGNNPFRKPNAAAAASSPTPAAGGAFNPFFKPQPASQPASSTSGEAPPPPPPPPPPPGGAQTASAAEAREAFSPPPPSASDDWEQIQERDANDSDSSDDDYATSRASRAGLASALFGNLASAPGSGAGSRPGSTAPAAPAAPPAALQKLGGGNPSAGRGALLSAIQGGGLGGLKKTPKTVDMSAPPVSGRVIGDAAPPDHIRTTAPEPHSPPPAADDSFTQKSSNRQSVDWYAGLAADQAQGHPAASYDSALGSTQEEDESVSNGNGNGTGGPDINVSNEDGEDLSEFDFSKCKYLLLPYLEGKVVRLS